MPDTHIQETLLPESMRQEILARIEEARLLYEDGNPRGAEAILRTILSYVPDCTPALYNLGKLNEEYGNHREAIHICEKILALEPNNADVTRRMGELYARMGDMPQGLQLFKKARELDPTDETISTDFLFHLNYMDLPEAAVFMEHIRFGDRFPALPKPPLQNRADTQIRIGYVSPDFRKHAASYWIRPLLRNHDKNKFRIYAYCNYQAHDEVTEEFRQHADVWREISTLSDQETANLIRNDGVDVLIDLAGHTGNNKLKAFALRPAPIQISWFGYLNTTGLSAMDYRLTDALMTPPERAPFYTEKLVYLPRAFAFESRVPKPVPTPLPALSRGYITFGSFNACEKINQKTILLWSQLLLRIPTSRLYMIIEPSTEFRESLLSQFAAQGVSQDRITIEFTKKIEQFLLAAQRVDIALDPFPYSGGVTVFHLASVGVPSLTLEGRTEFSRTGSSIMRHFGLEACVGTSANQFLEKGSTLSTDLNKLHVIRQELREKVGKDGAEVTRNVEQALVQLVTEARSSSTAQHRLK